MDFYLTSEEMLLCRCCEESFESPLKGYESLRFDLRSSSRDFFPEREREREKREKNSSRCCCCCCFLLNEESRYEIWLNINTRWMKYRFVLSVGEPWIEFNVLDRKFFFFLSNGMIKLFEQKRKKKEDFNLSGIQGLYL